MSSWTLIKNGEQEVSCIQAGFIVIIIEIQKKISENTIAAVRTQLAALIRRNTVTWG